MFQIKWILSYLVVGSFEHVQWTGTENKLLGSKNHYPISQTSGFRSERKEKTKIPTGF